MNAPEASPPTPDLPQLARSVQSLRLVLNLTLAVLILVTTMLNVVLVTQLRAIRRQVGEVQRNALNMARVVGDWETNTMPVLERLSLDLRKFADRNPDFLPLVAPYLGDAGPAKAPAGAMAPSTARPAPPKK